ncbi:MAG TPA: hypothetical protein VM557_01440 [Thermoanaerobaculia bacterium]|nr:hypothetical protein [Thermoanaerobaculia bacterium]
MEPRSERNSTLQTTPGLYIPEAGFDARRTAIGFTVLALAWLALIAPLMIADVWDETAGLQLFRDPSSSFAGDAELIWRQSIGLWRPLPSWIAAAVIRASPSFDSAWLTLRWLNALLIVTSAGLLTLAFIRWRMDLSPHPLWLPLLLLFSSGSISSATWFAAIFDVFVLFFLAAGVLCLAQRSPSVAGILFGVAFFCKETAILLFPLIAILWSAGRITARDAVRASIPPVFLGAVYFFLRGSRIRLGSGEDIHQFDIEQFGASLLGMADSFWIGALKTDGPILLGVLVLLASLAALRSWKVRGMALMLVLLAAAIYWGMFAQWQGGIVLSHLNFVGRLYLIPVTIAILALALDGRRWVFPLILLVGTTGAALTWRDHQRFQRAYRAAYELGSSSSVSVRIDYAERPLTDGRRNLEIGSFPDAAWTFDAREAKLTRRR